MYFFVIHALHAEIERPVRTLISVVDRPALVERPGHRLFAEDMLARGQRVERHPRMPVERRGDNDTVDRRVVEQTAVIRVTLRFGTQLLRRPQVGFVVVALGRPPRRGKSPADCGCGTGRATPFRSAPHGPVRPQPLDASRGAERHPRRRGQQRRATGQPSHIFQKIPAAYLRRFIVPVHDARYMCRHPALRNSGRCVFSVPRRRSSMRCSPPRRRADRPP